MPQPKQILSVDTLDDRREIHQLIRRLPPWKKLAFLSWACQTASLSPGSRTKPRPGFQTIELAKKAEARPGDDTLNERLSLEIYMDLWGLTSQWDFSLDDALRKLVEMVRGKCTP
jgi:hypothetical protein